MAARMRPIRMQLRFRCDSTCSKRRYPVPLPLTVTDLNSNLGLCAAAVSVSARAVDRRRQTSNLSLARWQSRIQGQGQPETLVAGFTLKRRRAISKNCVPRRNEMQCGWRLFAVVSVAVGRGGFLESSFLVEVVRRTTRASTRVFHLRPGKHGNRANSATQYPVPTFAPHAGPHTPVHHFCLSVPLVLHSKKFSSITTTTPAVTPS